MACASPQSAPPGHHLPTPGRHLRCPRLCVTAFREICNVMCMKPLHASADGSALRQMPSGRLGLLSRIVLSRIAGEPDFS